MHHRTTKSDSHKRYSERSSNFRHKRSRSRSRSPRRKYYSLSSEYEEKSRKIVDYKQELKRFLEENANIQDINEFWLFYDKYQNAQKNKSNDLDKNFLLNIDFNEKKEILYDKLPVLDRNGERVRISTSNFNEFLLVIKIFQDFQQKSKFLKLQKLRKSQRELPIAQYKKQIIDKLKDSRVILIAGNTGCGKSTQVPQYVLEAGCKKIACTQPRRIACISLAKRVAYEALADFKNTVGYQIRFEKSKRSDTNIIFMTEGLLLRQASEEETLNSYNVIILDEVHERHLHGDFLIGIMKCLLYKRKDIKVILMSATINIELFTNYFADENLEVIQVPGRLYPIEINYRPIVKDMYERKKDKFDCTPYLQILQMIDEKYLPHEKGDVLIFLNGFSEISTLADAVTQYSEEKKNWIVLPLHSSLSLEEQDKVFDYPPDGVRKCIISTNIAETSVTIDGIRFVIDSGKCNRMVYNTNLGISKLSETNISQDSAKQRCGRAGRTGPGVCYRLYSEEDFRNFDVFTPAEIHLVPLESLVLHMISLGLTDIEHFPFLEKPSQKALEQSLEKLKFTGALSLSENCLSLTPLGGALSQLPVDLSIGKMLIISTIFGNVNSVLALASLLSVQSPLTQNAYRNLEAETLRKPLESNHGDPLTLLSYYQEWLTIKQLSGPVQGGSKNKDHNSRIWTKKRCLEEQRFYEVTKLLEQFRDILSEANLLQKIEEELTSSERAIRYGELKHLKKLKYELKNEAKGAQRKQLKYEMYNFGEDSEKLDAKTDLRDVDFRIANNFKRLQKLLNEASADSLKDLMLLKIILTSGFYPQIAVEDEHNSSKTVSERLYHTKNKNYVFLRPMSYFAMNPEVLELANDDIEVPPPGYFSKRPISKTHQILVYQSILETKKVYLVNTMRMPCIQTLFLFGKTIATNSTLSKFVIDDFLTVDVPYVGLGQSLLLKVLALRKKWTKKVEYKLNNPMEKQSDREKEETFYFIEDLVKYMNSEVGYNLKRLLPADLKDLYTFSSENLDNIQDRTKNPFDKDYTMCPNLSKGGINVTENVIFDCLTQDEWAYDMEVQVFQSEFLCKHCQEGFSGQTILSLLQHEEFCDSQVKEVKREVEEERNSVVKRNSKQWFCDNCKNDLVLTPIEILRHKKSCNGGTSNS